MGEAIPHVEIKKAVKLWQEERPFFGCSMEQLGTFIRGDNLQDKLSAFAEWIQRYGYAFPQYSKDKRLDI